ncbi:MAG: GNAT family N-acetyltransferase [Clostridiales bacterium]|nr:GNAT family N-acetyltransferase [Clostridiales bacterium]
MALRGRLVDLTVAEGFAAYEGDQLIGLVTCALTGEDCEILSLDSLRPGEGLGGRLMRRAIDWAAERGAARVVLITTNDNTDALRFYQRMGFDLVRLGRDALRVSRRLKPSIPLTGEHGIPLRHELELALPLTRRVEDVKRGLTSAEAAPLLAASMFDPTPSRVAERARALQADPNAAAWGLYERAKLIGLIAVDRSEPGAARVRAIAVAEGARRSGVGAALVRHAGRMLAPGALIAETDDDAVGFYRKTGFSVEPLGEVYPGVRRYRCALNLPDGPGPRVEPLTAGDEGWIAQAAALLAQAFPHCYGEAGEAWSEVLDCLDDGRVALVALCGGGVVGFGGSRPHYGGNAWELHPLAIDAAHRRQGVGRLLVAALERVAAGRGGRVMYLGADDEFGRTSLSDGDLFDHTPDKLARIENRGGHPYSFYEKLGYRVVGALPDANGPRRPDIWMAKRI